MTLHQERFTVGDRPRVEVTNTSGDITVVAGDAHVVEVSIDPAGNDYSIEQRGDTIIVRPERGILKRIFSSDLVVRVPSGTDVEAKNASGDVAVEAAAANLDIATASGDVRVRTVGGNAIIKVASGDVSIDRVDGSLGLVSASGEVRVRSVGGDVDVKTASGDAILERAGGSVRMHSASGELKIGRHDGGDVQIRTLSGDVILGIPTRRTIELDMQSMSGDLVNRLPESDGSAPEATIRITLSSVSGDLILRAADRDAE
jgi:DUF4097 and DUF4098 domain-containing protein YvlB